MSLNSNELHRIFEKLDRNCDGLVSIDELKWLLDRIKITTSVEDIESLAGKTNLDLTEFLHFYENITRNDMSEEKMENNDFETDLVKAFEVFDMNGDGFISSEELQSALSHLGFWSEHSGKDVNTMINVYDANLDGFLDFQEFKINQESQASSMGGHQTKAQSNQSQKDVENLRAKTRFLQEKISEIMCLRETESQAYEQELMVLALKEAEWNRERKCLREEVKRLRKRSEEKGRRCREIGEKGEKQLHVAMRKDGARRDEAASTWKKLYLEIKIELDNLINRTNQEEDLLDELKRELIVKEKTIQLLQAHIASMEQEESRRESEVDILRQSLRIMSQSKKAKHIAKGGL